ncbi:hypothetical protein SAMN02745157_1445 [Kaistia soli DSM 19436]|uniref:Uncharacterized protein n=1 Tax=Kaistia soli DSM 19436 TaxID=1122133 RepID=A0A1M4Y737_9HYPH|nr:hypothetical protein [Kaistia soli]SHF01624.1 hypothetical protein SAMN02745157_1445 [Kaistia soli DSM 19436]
MDKPALPVGLITQIKATTRAMVLAAGGDAEVEALTGASRGQISKWKLDHHPDLMPIWAIAAIAFKTQDISFAAMLAEMASHQVVPVVGDGPSDANAADFVDDLIGLARTGAEMKSALGEAMSDRSVTPAEARVVLSEISKHKQTITRTERRLARVAARGNR